MMMAAALSVGFALLPAGDADAALARRLARSIDLYATYTGAWPASLDDLVRKPPGVDFWPEGGFWFGPLPARASWGKGEVSVGAARVPVSPPSRSAVVPPTDRLRAHYTAAIRLEWVRSRVEEQLHEKGSIEGLGELPLDPWGRPFAITTLKDRVRIGVEGSSGRQVLPGALTPEETRALEESSRAHVISEDRAAAVSLIEKLADDDLETRDEASLALRRLGPFVRPILIAKVEAEKSEDVRARMRRLLGHFPERSPAWLTQLRPLTSVVLIGKSPAAMRAYAASCQSNLRQLWQLQIIYMNRYGGRLKSMPRETGTDFWLALGNPKTPILDEDTWGVAVCPVSGREPKVGVCTYWGPAQTVFTLKEGDAVGLCEDEGHGDDVVLLRKSGEARIVPRGSAEHEAALKTTKR